MFIEPSSVEYLRQKQIDGFHSFCFFPYSCIFFPCMHFHNTCSVSFFWFIPFYFNFSSCFKLSSTSFGQSRLKQDPKPISKSYFIPFVYSIIIMTWLNFQLFTVVLRCWYNRYSICLISFLHLYELIPAFICFSNVRSLVNYLCGVKLLNPVPVFFFYFSRI